VFAVVEVVVVEVVEVVVWAAEVDVLVLDLADWHRVFPGHWMVMNRHLTCDF
jgi:hypothetical protein